MKYYITQQGLEFVNEISAKYAGTIAGNVVRRARNAETTARDTADYKSKRAEIKSKRKGPVFTSTDPSFVKKSDPLSPPGLSFKSKFIPNSSEN